MTIEHRWSDAWLLQSILLANKNGSSSLDAVIGYGDAIQHSIFTINELRYGISRLEWAGLITRQGSALLPTPAALTLWSRATERTTVLDQLEALAESMSASSSATHDPNAIDTEHVPAPLSQAVFDDALARYRATFERRLKSLRAES